MAPEGTALDRIADALESMNGVLNDMAEQQAIIADILQRLTFKPTYVGNDSDILMLRTHADSD